MYILQQSCERPSIVPYYVHVKQPCNVRLEPTIFNSFTLTTFPSARKHARAQSNTGHRRTQPLTRYRAVWLNDLWDQKISGEMKGTSRCKEIVFNVSTVHLQAFHLLPTHTPHTRTHTDTGADTHTFVTHTRAQLKHRSNFTTKDITPTRQLRTPTSTAASRSSLDGQSVAFT